METSARELTQAIHRDDVDGVPLFWADTPGPMTAALWFRVGSADEEIGERGATHLIEHAALEPFSTHDFDVNGVTELLHTGLFVRGRPDEVVETLAHVSTWLRTAAADAVDGVHNEVLAAEEHERRGGIGRQVLQLLFGNGPVGRAALPEYGLATISRDDVAAWALKWFGASNARLVLSGPPPAGLRLDLEPGSPQPVPPGTEPQLALPAWHEQEQDGCTVAMLTGRGAVASLTDELVAFAASERLRHEAGDTYGVSGDRIALALEGRRSGLSLIGFGLRPDRHVEGTRSFVELVSELADGAVDPDLVARLQRRRVRVNDEPAAALGLAHAMAREELLADDGQLERFLDEQFLVTADQIAAELRARRQDLLVVAPSPPVAANQIEWTPVPLWSSGGVDGQRYQPQPAMDPGVELRVDTGGATLVVNESGDAVTVPFDECEAMLRWDDGTRILLGRDGFKLPLRAESWPDLANLGPWLDARLHARIVEMGAAERPSGPADDQPEMPPPPASTAFPTRSELLLRFVLPSVGAGGLTFLLLVNDSDALGEEPRLAAVGLGILAAIVVLVAAGVRWVAEGRHRR